MATTDIKALGRAMADQEYHLPGWEPGTEFICRLRRPTLAGMLTATGFVPNPLMPVVADLFMPTAKKIDAIPLDQQNKALVAIARYALLEPTFDQIAESGLELTDQQYSAIYAYALGGTAGLGNFRRLTGGKPHGDVSGVQHSAVKAGGD